MTLLIVLALALGLGVSVPRRSMAFVPIVAGATLILVLVATGRDISDTPIPFIIVVASLAVVAGVLARGAIHPARRG